MYLKSIEVQGFKSFANKMKFQFHNGITGIVGPNGSGKSNVGDAVRWVLGEQSARQLRGSNMQDVIFSGTESRKPLGFASVAITLDNSDHKLPTDYEEVTVTRRLYRSGESEYLINGTACRLKDINEMFYDTGIGKEGYSIIGQGQIDKILSGKPEERRELFDEAAGIVKFKRRKLTAQKKLESENNNLTRVNDILSELTRQIGPLERQSEKAKIYLQKKEELKNYDINMFLLEMTRITGQLKEVEKDISISDNDISQAKEQLENAKAEYETSEKHLEELNQQIDEKKNQLNQGLIIKQQLESQIELLQEQIRSAKQNDNLYISRLETINHEIAVKKEQIEGEEKQKAQLDAELKSADEGESEALRLVEEMTAVVSELEQEISRGQAELIELLNERANTKTKLQRYDTMKEQIQIRNAELTKRLLMAKSEESELAQTESVLREEYADIVAGIESIIKDNASIEEKIQDVQKELALKSRQLEEAQAEYHREMFRLESLRNMTERYDGYGISIRKVMEQKNLQPGLHGVVADLIKTEKKYETAIETALGGSIQNIVTDNENTAKNMIDFLKKNRYGRATFLPLTAIRRRQGLAREQALYEPGALGVASTLVEADDIYDQLVEYLLGQTLVTDNIDHAIAIARKYKHSIRIVTLDGELLSPGGSMSGGAFKNSSNLLGRRREADDLEKNVQKQRERVEEIRRQIDELRQTRGKYRGDLENQTQVLQNEYLRQNTAKLKLDEIEQQKGKTASGHGQLQQEAQEMEAQLSEIGQAQTEIRQELEESGNHGKELEERIVRNQKILEEKKVLLETYQEELALCRTRTAGIRQRTEFSGDNLKRIEIEIEQLLVQRKETEDSRHESVGEVAEKEERIEQIRSSILQAQTDAKEMEDAVNELQLCKQQVSDVHKDFFRKREEMVQQMSALDKERFRLDNKKERLQDFQERQINYMWEEYGLTPSEASAYKNEEHVSGESLKKKISELKSEIKGLGSVNVNAIEEYREVSQRYEFLSAQHADLVKAGEALKGIISELDSGMRKQFSQQFAIMQKEFSKAFKELFGGGRGTLELVEDEDILEAGIRIIAQPPGKKLQNMMQMSGGEKALTAIALLFAIQNMKPSPFCLLDEIEAALDENNVVRYAGYLKKLTKNTQFIIITHRRGTMAAADRLYGITMQEKGVSTQVSVNMVEEELDQ
ncbi:MAG: chromosome segregation protein SMC [Eubacteriales bacterium]|nr:chromosome segregation protein SMC [Eubacteriales bacterium]